MNIIFWLIQIIKSFINKIKNLFCININKNKKKINFRKEKISENLYLLKLSGTYYNMGKQYGSLMKNIIIKDVDILNDYLELNRFKIIKNINYNVQQKINNNTSIIDIGYLLYLEFSYFIPDYYLNFIRGIAEITEINFKTLISINLFAEFNLNNSIVYSSFKNRKTLAIKTLDLDFPRLNQSIIVFNPNRYDSYLNFNLSILFGGTSMISKLGIIINSSNFDYTNYSYKNRGLPISVLFHNIMLFSRNLLDVKKILNKTKLINNLDISVIDINNNHGIVYKIDDNMISVHQNSRNHDSLIYSNNFNNHLNFYFDYHYNLDKAIENFLPTIKSGNLHIMIYYDNNIYVSNTSKKFLAYDNDYIKLNFKKIFNF